MVEKNENSSLEDRREKLARNLEKNSEKPESEEAKSGMGLGLRLSSEFVAAVLVGAVLGLGIDYLFDSAPWGMIAFLFLGFATAVRNVIRAANVLDGRGGRGEN